MSEERDKPARVRRDPFAERKVRAGSEAPAPPTPAPAPSPGAERARRDPFAERAARATRGGTEEARGQATAAAAAPGRVRRDPRAERGRTPGAPARPASGPRVRVIENPACLVLAVPDLDGGRLSSHDLDVLGAARSLADELGGAVAALAFTGEGGDLDLGGAGVDRALLATGAQVRGYAPEARALTVLAAIDRHEPRHVLFPDTPTGGGDVGRRVAARLGTRAAGNVQRLSASSIARRGRGGRSDFALAPPLVLLVAAEAADPIEGERFEARPLEPIAVECSSRVADRGLVAADPTTVPLAEAEFIVSAGNGVTDWELFHRLAAVLGATEAGSRPVCDAGHLPRARQVGASGTLVEPRCYVALGIAGAAQHLQGIAKSERVVSVNSDPYADIVKRADLSVVADVQAVMPALERLAKERLGGA